LTQDKDPSLTAREQRSANPERLVTFTDGVFAIVITILVLDIRVPDFGSGQALRESIEELQPTLVAFVVSFFLVGMYWSWHRGAFSQVRSVDLQTVWLNLLFLLPVSLVPFAASALGSHSEEPIVLHLYGAVLIAATLTRALLSWHLRRYPQLLWVAPSREESRITAWITVGIVAVYGVAMLVAGTARWLSLLLFAAVPLSYFIALLVLKANPKTEAAAQDLS
jgi:uncharacterized membrane protein